MIEFVSYADIDRIAYDRCVRESLNFRIYALSWYLDAVASEWDLLTLDNYQAVMPLPKRSKYGLSYVYTPQFVQQLGVFSRSEINPKTECEFYRRVRSKYFLMDYFSHSSSQCLLEAKEKRINYLIRLDRDRIDLESSFNKNRKRIVKQGFAGLVIEKDGDPELFIRMCMETDLGYEVSKNTLEDLGRLVRSNREMIKVWNVFEADRWAGGLVWASDHRRVTYLFPVTNELGKRAQVPTFIIYSLIEDHQGSDLILDLEGSMIEGVANFYRSFGAEKEIYYYFKSRCYGLF